MSRALWIADEAAAATGGHATTGWSATGISIDTRTLQPGDLFVALKDARDGHDFVVQALEKGAVGAMVSRIPEGVRAGAPLLIVPEVTAALEALGRAARARTGARVLAITGSAGKTSTKDMAACALASAGRVHAAEASLNNHWGVPLTLARMPQDTDFAILEIGMNHPGEIEPLAQLCRPHVALITTVAPAHLEAFEDIDGIAREKASIFSGLEPGGTAIIPADLETTPILRADAGEAHVVSFGRQGEAKLVSTSVKGGLTHAEALVDGRALSYTLASPGEHFAQNALGVLAAVDALGADPTRAAEALGYWRPFAGRGGIEDLDGLTLIDDSYNANPASLAAGMDAQARLGPGRRVVILGDMLELGPDEAAIHRAIAGWPQIDGIALVHACGSRMKHMFDALPPTKRGIWSETAEGLRDRVSELARDGDIVLVKGSKSSRVASVVDALRQARQRPLTTARG